MIIILIFQDLSVLGPVLDLNGVNEVVFSVAEE